MNEHRFTLRLAGAGMLLFLGLQWLIIGVKEAHARWLGAHAGSIILPLIGFVMVGAILVLGAAVVVYRTFRRRHVENRGLTAPATVTKTVQDDDGTWVVHFAYRDRQAKAREGRFRSETDVWRAGDTGEVRYLQESPAESVWVENETPREPAPLRQPPGSTKRFFGWYFFIVLAISLGIGALGTYMVWAQILREGLFTLAISEPWKILLLWALWAVLTGIAAIPVTIGVTLVGAMVLAMFAFIRHLRN